MKSAVIYARYSDPRQHETSIEVQVEQCTIYAKENGLTIVDTYIDRGLTATDDKRPDFKRMVSDCRKKTFEAIIVYKSDRFFRNNEQYYIYKQELRKNGVSLCIVHEAFDNTAMGRLQEAMVVAINSYSSEQSADRVVDGMRKTAEKGLYVGGTVPLGYKIENQEYVIDSEIAPIVQLVFAQYADGSLIQDLVDSLNTNGLRTSRGKLFTKNTFNSMLDNKRYTGTYIYKNGEIELPNRIPRIIDDETWERVQQRRRKVKFVNNSRFEYMLTGKVFCGACNEMMVGYSGTSKSLAQYHYYSCHNSKCSREWKYIPQQPLEDFVVDYCRELLTDENIDTIVKEVIKMSKAETNSPFLQKLNADLKEKEEAIENLAQALEKGEEVDFLLDRIKTKRSEISNIKSQIIEEEYKSIVLTEPEIKFFLTHLRNGNVNDDKYRRTLVDLFINRIIVYDDKCTILFNIGDREIGIRADDFIKLDKRTKKRKSKINTVFVSGYNRCATIYKGGQQTAFLYCDIHEMHRTADAG